MKICLVAPVSGWRGGMHQYSVHLANSLAERADVEVIGFSFTPQDGNSLLSSIEAAG